MNMKYLFRIVILFVFVSFPFGFVKAQKADFSLYEFVKDSIENYYNRSDFYDPDYTKGWFRVDEFLSWVDGNSVKLENVFKRYYTDEYISYPPEKDEDFVVLGGFLGAYYTASHCTYMDNIRRIGIQEGFSSSAGTDSITVSSEGDFVSFIMGGLHEGAHMMPYLCAGIRPNEPLDNLSELVTISAELTYGLPLKAGADSRAADMRKDLMQNKNLNRYYAQSLLALLQYDEISNLLENNQAQRLFNYKLEKSSFTLQDLLTDLIDIRGRKLTLEGEPVSLRQYLKLINVLPQKRDFVASWIAQFMQNLDMSAKLPKAKQPREWDEPSDSYEKYFIRNEKSIKHLLAEHTADLQTAPFPKGYY